MAKAKSKAPARRRAKRAELGELTVVGIGSSAGGLEALQRFFAQVPEDSGLAFVVIHHRDPTHRGLLVEILQRSTKLRVADAEEDEPLAPDRVYVAPPDRDVAIAEGRFRLTKPTSPRGLDLPIDFFFRSLADACGDRSVGVVLSGMGSDGTLGLRAIKAKAGFTLAQSLDTAKFSPMPRSAIEAQVVDVVAAADALPAKILALHGRMPLPPNAPEEPPGDAEAAALDRIFVLLRSSTGNDFSRYKRSTVLRRIYRRMGLHQIDGLERYARHLRENPKEIELLFKELLIGVTSFFRDPPAWEILRERVLPALVQGRAGGVIRAWVAGCSTGEEAYSLAIVLKEAIEQTHGIQNARVQVFATDLDRDAIETARAGVYPANIAADVSAARLRRFFVQEERGFRVSREIRGMVLFAVRNVTADPPFTKLDVLSCRNLLIYLAPELQKKLIPLFHYGLNPGGVLFLGNAETVGSFSNLFSPENAKARIYRRVEPAEAPVVDFPASFAAFPGGAEVDGGAEAAQGATHRNLQSLVDRLMIDRFSPAGVLTTASGDILYVTGHTGRYLEPAAGKANWNVFAMAREGLRHELASAFAAAQREAKGAVARDVRVRANGSAHLADLTVEKLASPDALRGRMLVVFRDLGVAPEPTRAEKAGARKKKTVQLADELRRSRVEAQNLREQMQTSEEELKSANEELQSTNEELQSTNEELTTSKEELQSMNEELQTVNNELQAKVDELSRSNNDMSNLLNSTDIATLFLDGELRVRRFTTQTSKLIKLIAGDAGRPVTDLAMNIDYPGLADDAREVLRTLVFREKLVPAHDGRWMLVRIMPYRTLENVIDGVVITFTDASAARKLEASLREQASQLRQLAESLPNLVWGARADGTCDYLSSQWVAYTGVPEAEQIGHRWLEQVHEKDRDALRREWSRAIQGSTMLDAQARLRSESGAYRWFKLRASPIRDEAGAVARWYGSCTDVDDLKRAADRK